MIISAILVIADLAFCMVIGYKTSKSAKDTDDYFIAGKNTGTLLLLLTAWASFSGAGNFIGQAGRGFQYGINAYWFWMGESLLGGILMGTIIAPYLARFRYVSMPHYISDYLCGGDRYIRAVGGIAALMPNIVWPGAQIMGIAYVLQQVFGVDYRISVIVCGIVLIAHTTMGGLSAVIYADALHGTIQMIFAVFVIFFGLKMFHFDIGTLKESVMAVDPGHWDMFVDKPIAIATSFFTGVVGATSNPIFWNRAFAAKDVATAKKSYGITFFCNIIMVFLIIAIGIATFTVNQQVGDQALVWAILNKMPMYVNILLPIGVFAACMSCADTHLNCAAANIVADIIDPNGKLTPRQGVIYAKIATLIAGIIAIICGLFSDYIYDLGTYGYTVCGGVLIPMFIIGLIMRDRTSDRFKSKLKVKAARIGVTLGVIVAILFEVVPPLYAILGGGVIPAMAATILGTLIPNLFLSSSAE
ncbi:MAG: sodium:solute symporter family protein [Lachnospiraceae bacterium]|nr:sodium:solute symporter family protein [Lachnospiraceae bacterium]